jgi:hypothetical protein
MNASTSVTPANSTTPTNSKAWLNPQACSEGIKEPGNPKAVLALLEEWMADDSGYDEPVWPALKAALEANRAGERRLFNE